MAIPGSITISASGSGLSFASVVTKSGGMGPPIDEDILANQTDLLFNIAFDKDRLELCVLLATEDLTIETNDGTTPGDTINLLADEALIYWKNGPYPNPFNSADVTAWYLTNTTACNLKGLIIHDPTA